MCVLCEEVYVCVVMRCMCVLCEEVYVCVV